MQTDINAAWQQRKEERKSLRANLNNGILRKAVKEARKTLEKVHWAAALSTV